jgi:two-component system sensor histidine kinase MprB
MSLANRIAVLAACAVGFAVALASLSAYLILRSQLHNRLDDSLLKRARLASHTVYIQNGDHIAHVQIPNVVLDVAQVQFYVVNSAGKIKGLKRETQIGSATRAEVLVARGRLDHAFTTIDEAGSDYRAVVVPIDGQPGLALLFTQSQEPIENTIDRVGLVLIIVGAAGIVAAAIIGRAVARSALRPVRRLSAAAEHIARTEELAPIPVTGDDELARLAASFNDMLAALQRSRDRQKQLVVDAGHELRTPLTSLRTNLELLAQADRQGGMAESFRQEIFGDVTAQVEELSTLVGDLVELAREEPLSRTPEPLDLADIVARAVDRVRRRAPSVLFDARVASWWVVGEAQVLERAVLNLLDNAAKWSPPGGTVTIVLERGELSVSDQGPGVAESDLPLVFERFYRASDARTMPGSGLGLSIVRQAAERHGGSVRATNRQPHGAVFTMSLPGSPYRPPPPMPPVDVLATGYPSAPWAGPSPAAMPAGSTPGVGGPGRPGEPR